MPFAVVCGPNAMGHGEPAPWGPLSVLQARHATPWALAVPWVVFLNDVLPYASLSEPRDDWRCAPRGMGPGPQSGDTVTPTVRTVVPEVRGVVTFPAVIRPWQAIANKRQNEISSSQLFASISQPLVSRGTRIRGSKLPYGRRTGLFQREGGLPRPPLGACSTGATPPVGGLSEG